MFDPSILPAAPPPGDPATLPRSSAPSTDQFLRLLVFQLRNQDPLNPLKDHEFTAQLAQFSSLEQLTKIHASLSAIGSSQQSLLDSQALNLLGKTAIVSGQESVRIAGGEPDALHVEAPAEATRVRIRVKDADGRVVRTIEVPAGAGRRPVAWDGTDDAGAPLADGEYAIEIEAADARGDAVEATLLVSLVIDGISFDAGIPRLLSGGREVSFDRIRELKTV